MNRLGTIRRDRGLRQTDFEPIQGADISKLECNRFCPTPLQMEIINSRLGTTVNDVFDRADLVTLLPSKSSVRQREREQEQDIAKITLRVPSELASRFRELCKGHTQAEVFEIMLIKMEKDRRHRTMASGRRKNITATL